MIRKLGTFVIVVLSILLTCAQTNAQQIKSEAELVSVLCRVQQDGQSREDLLKANLQLVDTRLWTDLNNRASAAYYGPSPEYSIAIYQVAVQVAVLLQN